MAFVLSLLMALVLVSYGPGGSLGCDLSQNHVLFGRKNLRLLGEMRRISPRFCLQDRKDFAFPQEMVEGGQLQEAQAISVLHEMLQQSFNLFHTERASAAWDTTLLEQLRTGLHQQLDDLDACLGQVMGEEDSALGRTGPTLAVKRYFQGIHVYLQEKEYSDCAWETVRVEIMSCFLCQQVPKKTQEVRRNLILSDSCPSSDTSRFSHFQNSDFCLSDERV